MHIREEARSPHFFDGATDEDVHTLVIRKLKERVGGLADKIHTGRSRNDQVSLDTRLWLREQIDLTCGLADAFLKALLDIARRYPDAIIPGYTHTRRAQPVPWAHYILAYFEMFARDRERFVECRRRVNVMPLGSGALAGSGFPIDREAIARDLDFDGITRNSMDASGDRDFSLDFLYAASMIMLHLSRFAEDWILYSGEEYRWMELGDEVTSGSSIMPQKKNPDSLELIRGKCGRVFGCAQLAVRHDEGPAHDLQSRHAGGQGAAVRRRRPGGGSLEMARVVVESARLESRSAAGRRRRELGGCNRPGGRTGTLRNAVSSGASDGRADWCSRAFDRARSPRTGRPKNWPPSPRSSLPDMIRFLHPAEGMKTRELPGGSGPHDGGESAGRSRSPAGRV